MKNAGFKSYLLLFVAGLMLWTCKGREKPETEVVAVDSISIGESLPDTIIDSRYTFQEAVAGSKAPKDVIEQLELIEVNYLSTDGKIHRGQVLTNEKIAEDLRYMFNFLMDKGFVVEKAIPIVKYNWSDSLSMDDNNTSSFCYRNVSYSKHAQGMAIDINPRFNPLQWKHLNRPNQPAGAVLDTTVNGTFYPGHFAVEEFRKRGFRWGHSFSKYCDDHHFDKR
jgi:hypothetical protein